MKIQQPMESGTIKFMAGLIVGLMLAAAVPLIVISTGLVNMAASQEPSRLETRFGTMTWKKSMEKRAFDIKNPYAGDPKAIALGMDHFKDNCIVCHAAPGVEKSKIAKGLNPPAPGLDWDFVQDMTDGQLFWVIKNGIRMTGMPAFGPTHKDQEIWQTEAFIRHLLHLTPEEKAALLR